MPIHFEFNASPDFPESIGLKTYMEKSRNPVVKRYLKAILANGEVELGRGLAAVVYLIGKNSVCYMSTDADKHDYLRKYLRITNEEQFPSAKIKIKSWDTEKDKFVYIFGAERLFLVEDLAPNKHALWIGRIDKMMFLYRELRRERGKEIFLIQDPNLFVEFCNKLVKKDPFWKESLEPVRRWAKEEGHRFPDVLLDLKSANILFKHNGTVAYIADPLSHTASASLVREELIAALALSRQQKSCILELMTDFLSDDMPISQFKKQLNDITR